MQRRHGRWTVQAEARELCYDITGALTGVGCPNAVLLRHTGQPYVATEEPGTDPAPGARTYPWTIDNKYYTARIHFRAVPAAGFATDATDAALFLLHKDEVRRCLCACCATVSRCVPAWRWYRLYLSVWVWVCVWVCLCISVHVGMYGVCRRCRAVTSGCVCVCV
jgi:hypothetical protein